MSECKGVCITTKMASMNVGSPAVGGTAEF